MKRIIYSEELFSKRREILIDYCCELQKLGKRFLYILPNRESLKNVRESFINTLGGLINSYVIMIDELEKLLTEGVMDKSRLINKDYSHYFLGNIIEENVDKLKFYKKIYNKKGFIEESYTFIKALKRHNMDGDKLLDIINKVENEILKDKLKDLYVIYNEYTNVLNNKNLYDVDDVGLKAIEVVSDGNILKNYDAIIIDGFINIDKVDLDILKAICETSDIDIFANCSFNNELTKPFFKNVMIDVFEEMNFETINENIEHYEVNEGIKSLSKAIYSGNKVNVNNCLTINKYPCIEAEVRETARDIKLKLLSGENPNDIAIYVNKLDAYEEHIINVFNEFNIPCELSSKFNLLDFNYIKNIVLYFKEINEIYSYSYLFEILDKKLEDCLLNIKESYNKLTLEDIPYEDKLIIKSYEEFKRAIDSFKQHIEMVDLIEKEIKTSEFYEILLSITKIKTINIDSMRVESIKILNTDMAKGTFYNHIYVLCLNEGEVPTVIKNNGLFNDSDIKSLENYSINYRNYDYELKREKIRFNLTLSSAKDSIVLSYRNADENGKFIIASPFADEIKFITGIKENKEMTMRDRFDLPINEVMSGKELKLSLLKNIFENQYKDIEDLNINENIDIVNRFEKDIEELLINGNIEFIRNNGEVLTKYEGIIEDIDDLMIKKYFSPSSINTYFSCPFKYMLQYQLGIFSLEEKDDEYNALEIGNLYHNVLYKYFLNQEISDMYDIDNNLTFILNEKRLKGIFDLEYSSLRSLNISEEEYKILESNYWDKLLKFMTLEKKRLDNYSKNTGNILYPKLLEEKYVDEEVFGIPISCKVDRVDLEYEISNGEFVPTGKFIVIDYKKKSVKKLDDFLNKEDSQLAIYYYLVKNKLLKEFPEDELECIALLYLSIEDVNKASLKIEGLFKEDNKKALGTSRKLNLDNYSFDVILRYIRKLIIETSDNIKNGIFNYEISCREFDSSAFNTGYTCSFKDVCRYNKNKVKSITSNIKGGYCV